MVPLSTTLDVRTLYLLPIINPYYLEREKHSTKTPERGKMPVSDQFSVKILLFVSCLSLVTTLTSLLPAQVLAVVAATVVIYAAAMTNAKLYVSGTPTGSLSSFSIWMLPIAATAALIGIYVWIFSFGGVSFNEVKSVYILLTGVVCTFATFRPLFWFNFGRPVLCSLYHHCVGTNILQFMWNDFLDCGFLVSSHTQNSYIKLSKMPFYCAFLCSSWNSVNLAK